MYSRYDPTVHDTFLPVGREETKTIELAPVVPPDEGEPAAVTQNGSTAALPQGTAQSVSAASATKGGALDGLKGLFGGASRGLLGSLDLGDVILLLIVALLFLEGGSEGDLIILLAVALFIGF